LATSLTVQEVADVAGQSVRTLYQYFESKDDLLLAVHEEAMRTYARLIRDAIASFDDPVERLAAGVIASARLPAVHHKAGRDRGLSRLRLQLAQADPALLAR
jgi:AcrR family transcriptional regulator